MGILALKCTIEEVEKETIYIIDHCGHGKNSRNQERKAARKRIPNEILEEIREKKRNDMTNRRCSMDTQQIPIVEDAIVLPNNPHQERQKNSLEGSSVIISVEERALHGTDQGVKRRCTSRPPKTFAYLIGC